MTTHKPLQMNIRVSAKLRQLLRTLADREDTSVSSIVRRAVVEYAMRYRNDKR